jgi:hypothetical protein
LTTVEVRKWVFMLALMTLRAKERVCVGVYSHEQMQNPMVVVGMNKIRGIYGVESREISRWGRGGHQGFILGERGEFGEMEEVEVGKLYYYTERRIKEEIMDEIDDEEDNKNEISNDNLDDEVKHDEIEESEQESVKEEVHVMKPKMDEFKPYVNYKVKFTLLTLGN